jgi:predicted RND superfamily exporter protein
LSASQPNLIRDRIEKAFEAWGYFAFRHAFPMIVGMLALSALLISRVPSLETDNSTDSFLHANDPIRITYDDFRRQFGRDDRITIAIEAPDLFDPHFLARLKTFHDELEAEVPHLDDLVSMVNARNTRGEGDELVVEDLLENWPETPEELAALRERVLANPLYRNTLISRDATITTVSIELAAYSDPGDAEDALAGFDDESEATEAGKDAPSFLKDVELAEAVRAARAVVERYQTPGFRLHMAGAPVMSERITTRMQSDMRAFTAYSIVVIGALLFLLFRRIAGTFLPLLVVVLSMLSTLGMMQLAGGKMSVATQILPSFLLAVGVGASVHILAIFYQRLDSGSSKQEAVAFALGHSGLAVVMTSLTTAGGLGSFVIGEFKPVADLGIYAPLGVMFSLVFTLVLLPALIAVIPMRPRRRRSDERPDLITRVLQGLGDFSATHPWSVVAVTLSILAVSGMGISLVRFSHNPMDWFPESAHFRAATLFMNEKLDGVNVVEVLVHTGRENGVQDPALLERLDAVRIEASRIHQGEWHIGKTISIVDVLKEIHQALNENRPEFRVIPQGRELVAQELLLFENSGSDDLEDFVDPLFSSARITLRVPWMDAFAFPALLDDLGRRLRRVLGDGVEVEITGLVPLLSRTFRAMIESMARSYVVALLVIVPLMILLIGHFTRGLLSMIPNLTPVLMMLGYMGWTGIPIDGLTMMVGAIVIGLAVDDTIHFMHNFRRYYERSGDARAAIRETLETTGRALTVTTLVLTAGFFVFTGAYMYNVKVFGLLAGSAILIALVANVILASSLMILATSREARRATRTAPDGAARARTGSPGDASG